MIDEERQRQMDFILNQHAQFAVNMQKLEEAETRASKRVDGLERVLGLPIRANRREREETREQFNALVNAQTHTEDVVARLDESQAKLAEALTKLAESQVHADK